MVEQIHTLPITKTSISPGPSGSAQTRLGLTQLGRPQEKHIQISKTQTSEITKTEKVHVKREHIQFKAD